MSSATPPSMEQCTTQLQSFCHTQEEIQQILLRMYQLVVSYRSQLFEENESLVPDYVWTLVDILLQLILTQNTSEQSRELAMSVLQTLCLFFSDVCDRICLDPADKWDAMVQYARNDTSSSFRAVFWSLVNSLAAKSNKYHPRLRSLLDSCVHIILSFHDQNGLIRTESTFHCLQFIGNLSLYPANHTFLVQHPGVLQLLGYYSSSSIDDTFYMVAILTCANLGMEISLHDCVVVAALLDCATKSNYNSIQLSLAEVDFIEKWKLLSTLSRLLNDPIKRSFLLEVGLCKRMEKILSDKTASSKVISLALECLWLLQK